MRNVMRNVSTPTTLACERLKRGSLGDATHPGLRIMARPSGAKVWIYRFRDPAGKMAQLLIGSFPALSLADARSEWRNHRATRDKHGDPRDDVRRRQRRSLRHALARCGPRCENLDAYPGKNQLRACSTPPARMRARPGCIVINAARRRGDWRCLQAIYERV